MTTLATTGDTDMADPTRIPPKGGSGTAPPRKTPVQEPTEPVDPVDRLRHAIHAVATSHGPWKVLYEVAEELRPYFPHERDVAGR